MTDQNNASHVVVATRDIAAPAAVIFELIADPTEQPRWDGNGNLAAGKSGERVHAVGDEFSMTLTGGSVRLNAITEFSEGRRIAWKPREVDHEPPGHLWRWELEPIDDSRTRVTQTYDWTDLDRTDVRRVRRAEATTRASLMASMDRLASIAESRPQAG